MIWEILISVNLVCFFGGLFMAIIGILLEEFSKTKKAKTIKKIGFISTFVSFALFLLELLAYLVYVLWR